MIETETRTPTTRYAEAARTNEDSTSSPLLEGVGLESDRSLSKTNTDTEVDDSLPEETRVSALELFITQPKAIKEIELTEGRDQVVLALVAQGMTLSMISEIKGMPSVYDVKKWSRKNKDFREALKIAEEAKAEILADTALSVANDATWQTSKADSIKIDLAMKLAAAYDSDKFGQKMNTKSEHSSTFTFVIDTGFNHPGESRMLKPIEIEKRDPSEVLKEERDHEQRSSEQGNQDGVPPENTSVGTEIETEEI